MRGLLHVSGDGLRVVDDDTKGLIVDQTIEKVSFCAPDRNHERGFSYICRDGTTRRWMCHGFLANKDSGERLSHAVGCAFAVCLERKQRRDKECGVTMTFDMKNSTFTRSGSFRTQSITERLNSNERGIDTPSAVVPPQPKTAAHNPFAIERPHATPSMLERQGSFRAFNALGTQSPFKRQMSLRINDLPSNAERQKAFLDPLTNGQIRSVSPIPEISPLHQTDTVSQLCQELSQGLSLLTRTDTDDLNFNNITSINQNTAAIMLGSPVSTVTSPMYSSNVGMSILSSPTRQHSTTAVTATVVSVFPTPQPPLAATNNITSSSSSTSSSTVTLPLSTVGSHSTAIPTAQISPRHRVITSSSTTGIATMPLQKSPTSPSKKPIAIVDGSPTTSQLPNPDQWLGQVVKSTSPSPRRAPPLHARTKSLNSAPDPFDAEWAAGVTKPLTTTSAVHNTNPFISPPKPPAQSFQVQL